MRLFISIVALGLLGLAVLNEQSWGFGRGGGRAGGGGARPAPSFNPPPAARPSGGRPGGGGSVAGPHPGAIGGNNQRPAAGGQGGRPAQGGGVNIGNNGTINKGTANRLPDRPGQGGAGTQRPPDGGRLPNRPGQGGSGTRWPNNGGNGTLFPGGGTRPGEGPTIHHFPNQGGLGSIAKNANIGNTTNVGNRVVNNPTVNVSRNNLVNTGNNVRRDFNHYGCFRPDWWRGHAGAWRAAGWTTAAAVWAVPTWAAASNYCGFTAAPITYDYGSSVVYQGDQVYVNGDAAGTPADYAQQAITIADTGRAAQASDKDDWLSLGVFGMVQGSETNANTLFQLAVNKAGVIRGNYYDALSDTTLPLYGQVDQKTQRAAWTVGDKKNVVYEAGFNNLTKDETTMMVHFGKDRSQQWTLVRVQQPEGSK
jgi:hypothetical protein